MDNTPQDNNNIMLTSISMRTNPSYELYGRMEDLDRKLQSVYRDQPD